MASKANAARKEMRFADEEMCMIRTPARRRSARLFARLAHIRQGTPSEHRLEAFALKHCLGAVMLEG
jgi:hypothetical protein